MSFRAENAAFRAGAACPKDKTCPAACFTDLDLTLWHHDGIHFCVDKGLMEGTSAITFAPRMDTSRAMIVTILWRLQDSPGGQLRFEL